MLNNTNQDYIYVLSKVHLYREKKETNQVIQPSFYKKRIYSLPIQAAE